jgi:epoxide hydrolase
MPDTDRIEPFDLAVPEADLVELDQRLARTRWPQEIEGVGGAYGMPVERLRGLVDHWREEYDWRTAEREINALPNFVTEVEGQRIHFVHVRAGGSAAAEPGGPAGRGAPAILLTHGWPSSFLELTPLIGPLGAAGFDLVIPSLPGFTLSGPTTERGWGVERTARAWATLMERLGYERYLVHGGDFGAPISRALGVAEPERTVGVHLTQLASATAGRGEATDDDPKAQRSRAARDRYRRDLSGYFWLQCQRPQTLAFGLADSPAFQLAWIAERFADWSAADAPDELVGRDFLLTTASLYWLTDTAASSSRIYMEQARELKGPPAPSTVPTAVLDLPDNIDHPLRRLAEEQDHIVRWTEAPAGAHFPAREVPDLLAADLLAFASQLGHGAD